MKPVTATALLKLAETVIVSIGLLVAAQIVLQWQFDLDVSLNPYELGFAALLAVVMIAWRSGTPERPVRKPRPIAEDTADWHFGRNAIGFGVAVFGFVAAIATAGLVLPTLDPVIETTVGRVVTVPLALVGVVGAVRFQRQRKRRRSASASAQL